MSVQISYDKEVQVIRADGKNLIDLSSVKDGSKATLYSRRGSEQDSAFEAIFRFNDDEQCPVNPDQEKQATANNKARIKPNPPPIFIDNLMIFLCVVSVC